MRSFVASMSKLIPLAIALNGISTAEATPSAASSEWSRDFGFPGTSGQVNCTLVHGKKLYVGGAFVGAGTTPTGTLAMWDGKDWSAVPGWSGPEVRSLAHHQGHLVVVTNQGVFVQRGRSFELVPDSMYPSFRSSFVYEGDLYLSRVLSTAPLWRFDGRSLEPVPGVTGFINRMLAYADEMVLLGAIRRTTDDLSRGVVAWNRAEFRLLGETLISDGIATVYGGRLLIRSRDWGVIAWDGATWEPLSPGIALQRPVDIHAVGDRLYGILGQSSSTSLVELVAGRWLSHGRVEASTSTPRVRELSTYRSDLLVSGELMGFDGYSSTGLFRYDGIQPRGLYAEPDHANALSGLTKQAITYRGQLIVAGGALVSRGQRLGSLAAWDGHVWAALGAVVIGQIESLAVIDDELYVLGQLPFEGVDVPALIWNGESWRRIQPSWLVGSCKGIVEYGGELVMTGHVSPSGVRTPAAVFRGGSWVKIDLHPALVDVVAHGWDDELLFLTRGNATSPMAQAWNGSQTHFVISELKGSVTDVASNGRALFLAGTFHNILTNEPIRGGLIALRDGRWFRVGAPVGLRQPRILTSDGADILAFRFGETDPGTVPHAGMRLADQAWTPIGEAGEGGAVTDALFDAGRLVLVGGTFVFGDVLAGGVAIQPAGIRADPLRETAVASVRQNGLHVAPAAPNPANPSVLISFRLEQSSDVSFDVYDLSGRRVFRRDAQRYPRGEHRFRWDGIDSRGARVASGAYIATVRTAQRTESVRFTLLK